jgi:hypothetical protein
MMSIGRGCGNELEDLSRGMDVICRDVRCRYGDHDFNRMEVIEVHVANTSCAANNADPGAADC